MSTLIVLTSSQILNKDIDIIKRTSIYNIDDDVSRVNLNAKRSLVQPPVQIKTSQFQKSRQIDTRKDVNLPTEPETQPRLLNFKSLHQNIANNTIMKKFKSMVQSNNNTNLNLTKKQTIVQMLSVSSEDSS